MAPLTTASVGSALTDVRQATSPAMLTARGHLLCSRPRTPDHERVARAEPPGQRNRGGMCHNGVSLTSCDATVV